MKNGVNINVMHNKKMKNLYIIFGLFFLISCANQITKNADTHKLILDNEEVTSIYFLCGKDSLKFTEKEQQDFINKVNTAKSMGPMKGIVTKSIVIFTNNKDTISIRLFENHFKWSKGDDWAYSLAYNKNYFEQKCPNKSGITDIGLSNKPLKLISPIKTIDRIFNEYIKYEETTESSTNLDSVRQALMLLEKEAVSVKDLGLIVNVWMHYDVTDFPTREYTEKVFWAHKEATIEVIKDRIKRKKEWESDESAPFSELNGLILRLKSK